MWPAWDWVQRGGAVTRGQSIPRGHKKERCPGRLLLPQQLSTDLLSERCSQRNKQLPLLRIKANVFLFCLSSHRSRVRSTCSKPGRKPSWALYGGATVGPQTYLAQPEHGHAAPQPQPRGYTECSPGLLIQNLPHHRPGLPGGGPAPHLPSAHAKPRGRATLCATWGSGCHRGPCASLERIRSGRD